MLRIYVKPEATLLTVEENINVTSHNESSEGNYGEAKPIELEEMNEIWTNDKEWVMIILITILCCALTFAVGFNLDKLHQNVNDFFNKLREE